MKVIHVSAWAKTFTQFRMPMLQQLRDISDSQVIYCPDTDAHYDRLTQGGYEVLTGPVSKGFSISILTEIIQLVRLLRERPFDVLIAHQPMAALVGITAAKLVGVPVKIYSTGGLKYVPDLNSIGNTLMRIGETRLMKWSNAILLVNKEDQLTLESLQIDPTTVFYVGPRGGCGIDTAVFNPQERAKFYGSSRDELGLEHDDIAIGFVGRCVWEKGLRELAEAAAILLRKETRRHLRFCILGNGEDVAKFKELLGSLGVADAFLFPGYLPDIHKYVAAFDIFVLPSYREGLPISLLEAQAMGIPSVATDVRGSRELVQDDATGLLVASRDPGALADALRRLADEPETGQRLATAAVDNIRASYSEAALLPRTIDIILATYEEAVRRGTSPP